ncbi:DUF1631 family protein [Stenotrophomonas ginsengisoli]|uniref:DUF1631 family protein n=1 Tax=Stenotrophomonas ginsengisoli TaxID=336566 RepID=UPI000ADFE17C|nr:DUF1631 family protein [Stenotrophomonas ginsengisoli]
MAGSPRTPPSIELPAALPPRVSGLLEQLQQLTQQILLTPLTLTIVELERDLMRHADVARNSQLQMDLLGQARHVMPMGEAFARHYLSLSGRALTSLHEADARLPADAVAAPATELSLVQDIEIDRDIVLADLARREAPRHASALHVLSQRMAVLAARPAYDIEQVPLSPHWLCRRLPQASSLLDLSAEASLVLYKAFGRMVFERQAELLERANSLLASQGVLPGLVYQPFLPRPAGRRRSAGPADADAPSPHGNSAASGNSASTSPAGTGGADRPLTQWQGQAPASGWRQSLHAATADAAAASAAAAALQPGQALNAAVSEEDLADLQQMLSAARQTYGNQLPLSSASLPLQAGNGLPAAGPEADMSATQASAAPGPALSSPVVNNLLARLQGLTAAKPASPGRSIEDIRNALLAQARAEHGPAAQLSPRDNDTMDLLGLLYRQIQAHMRSDASAGELLTQLQLPVVRAAISDPGFFVRDEHPARELLNAVAESGALWLGNEDVDPVLVAKLGQTVHKVVNDYDGDEQVFANATEEIQAHYRSAVHKAELAERRFIEAARGKERLESARRVADKTIQAACDSEPAPPRFVQNLMRQAWNDVLMLTLLRQGEQSGEWEQQVAATRQIVALTTQAAGNPADEDFGQSLEKALGQVGYHGEEAGAIARRLSTPGGEDAITSRTELTARLQARSRLGDQGGRQDEAVERPAPPPARNTTEESCYQQLRELPFGTWFDFHTNQQGDTRRLRMSWFSQLTDNALFVNARGQKVAEHTMDSLARLMASGQLRIVNESQGRLIDRAWQATLRTLRSLAGRGGNKESA